MDKIIILDYGSQYTQLIARRIREQHVYSEIVPFSVTAAKVREIAPKGLILSGGPNSVFEPGAPGIDREIFSLGIPILGVCYGMQLMSQELGGKVQPGERREYGKTEMSVEPGNILFKGLPDRFVVWMSHGDRVASIPDSFKTSATSANCPYAAIRDESRRFFGIQFHPEVVHTEHGRHILSNFVFLVCGAHADWRLTTRIEDSVSRLKEQIGDDRVGVNADISATPRKGKTYMTKSLLSIACLGASFAALGVEPVSVRPLNGEWSFLRDDAEKVVASAADYDASSWSKVTVPHDWAISGPFNPNVAGWQGKLPWRGSGWYRKTIAISENELKDIRENRKAVYLEFDGVMARPEVWVNGTKAGGWDYGYMSFWMEVAKLLRPGSNAIAVHCSTKDHSSRWYPGAGIYRPVRMVVRPEVHVIPGSMDITTPEVSAEKATVRVRYETVRGKKDYTFEVAKPVLWDVENPNLYTLVAEGETFRYGIRTFKFDADKGFFLNGRRLQLKGVDLHSDMGPLGMAFDRDVMKRQLLIMKDMGFNALRTSHNAVAPDVLSLCDELGVFVWNECFDKWFRFAGRRASENLEEYISRNLRQYVRRDRNHPSVFCWSIGNEIGPINHDGFPCGMTTERFRIFRSVIREEDVTRPVTIGCCSGLGHEGVDFSALDMTGWNYGANYRRMHAKHPQMPVLYSESASAVSEYGFYEQPPARSKTDYSRATLQVGSYDHNAAPWSDIPDVEFNYMEQDPYCGGEFVWTGIDYLGEPTPIANGKHFGIKTNECETARSSYFGIVDLCGVPKDRFYLYRSHWNGKSETLHILPHWNWRGREGQKTPVYVYTSGDEAELFLNGKSLGRRRKESPQVRPNLAAGKKATASSTQQYAADKYHAPEHALDGVSDTRWCASGYRTNEWLQVDLGAKTAFDAVVLQLESPSPNYGYTISLSDDGQTWSEHVRKEMGASIGAFRKAASARYLRVSFTALKSGVWASVRQLLVQKGVDDACLQSPYYDVCSKYRLRWFDVAYEPGELKAVAYRKGRKIGETVMRTAAKPVAVRLTDDPFNPQDARTRFVQVDLVDADGVRDPLAMNRVKFALSGPGKIVAVGNGNPRGLDVFTDVASHPLYYGKAVAVVRFDENATAPLRLTATVDGLKSATLEIARPVKFLFMSDTHVESDFMERGHPVYTCWQPGDHAALVRTYEFISSDPYCRDARFALFCGDQVNTGYTTQQNFLEEEMKNYFRTLESLDLYRKSRGSDLSSFKFVTRPYTCRENTRKAFDVTPPPLDSRVIAIQGNHDTGCREFYRDSAFQCGDVRFVSFFASYVGLPAPKGHYRSTARISDETVAFVEREMAAAAADPQIRHIVLCSHWAIALNDPKNFHSPIYDACKENKFNDNRRKILALAEKYGCDLYLNGHEHNGRWPFAKVGCLTDVNCGSVTSESASFALVEIHADKAVFNVYRRAAARSGKDGSGLDFHQLPERQATFEIPLKPIR